MSRVLVIVHDRSETWHRQLRGRTTRPSTRWVETRTPNDLARALDLSTAPVVVISLGESIRPGLQDLALVSARSPDALAMVIDPVGRPGVAGLARELGAALAVGPETTPPRVASLVDRWIGLAARRLEAEGWSPAVAPDPDTWESWLAALLEPPPPIPPHEAPPRTDPDARP